MKADANGVYLVRIEMDNSAFCEPHGSEEELSRILESLAKLCRNVGPYEGTLFDSNGNTVGEASKS